MAVHRLDPWPVTWNQLADPAMDGDAGSGNNLYANCGPESVAECIKYIADVSLDADYIKDAVKGANYVGYTYFSDLQTYLQTYAGIPTGSVFQADAPTVATHIKQWIDGGYAAIGLFYWGVMNTPDLSGPQTGGHFCPVFGYVDDGTMVISDPWGGRLRNLTPAQWAYASQGMALRCGRKRAIVY